MRLLKIPKALLRAAVPTMGGGTNAPEVRVKLCLRNLTAGFPSDHEDIFQTDPLSRNQAQVHTGQAKESSALLHFAQVDFSV